MGTTRGSQSLALSLTHQTVLTSLGQEKDEEGEEDPSQVKTSIAHWFPSEWRCWPSSQASCSMPDALGDSDRVPQ